jgi:hypothetical protein
MKRTKTNSAHFREVRSNYQNAKVKISAREARGAFSYTPSSMHKSNIALDLPWKNRSRAPEVLRPTVRQLGRVDALARATKGYLVNFCQANRRDIITRESIQQSRGGGGAKLHWSDWCMDLLCIAVGNVS